MQYEQSRFTIEFVHESYWLCERFVYGQSSVLAGQEGRQLLKPYDSLTDATTSNPSATVTDEYYVRPEVARIPPNDWDPDYCGESWEEPE
jgi:hypothetical protein